MPSNPRELAAALLSALLAAALPALLPMQAAGAASSSGHLLGIHSHQLDAAGHAGSGFTAMRLWDTGTAWRLLEPTPGQWDFRRLDGYVDLAARQGRSVLLTLGSTPAWASARPDERCAYGKACAAPPRRLADWRNYVDVVSRRYRGRIACYELWNEVRYHHGEDPSDPGGAPAFFSGSLDELLDLARSAAEIIRRNDPDACILSPSFHNASPDWVRNLDRFLQRGGATLIDGVSFHFYGLTPEKTVSAMRAVRQTLQKNRIGGKPVWNTEFGFDLPLFARDGDATDASVAHLSALIARSAILAAAEGVARSYWYALDNRNSGIYHKYPGQLDRFNGAMSALAATLRDFRFADCRPRPGEMWLCRLSQSGGGRAAGVVAWSTAANRAMACIDEAAALPAAATARSVLPDAPFQWRPGRFCVGPSPVLLLQT